MKNIVKRILCSAMVAISAVFAGSFASANPNDWSKKIVVQFQVPEDQLIPIQIDSRCKLSIPSLWGEESKPATVKEWFLLSEPLVKEGVCMGCPTYAVVLEYNSKTIDILHPTLEYSPFGVPRDVTLNFNNRSIYGKKCDETPGELVAKIGYAGSK